METNHSIRSSIDKSGTISKLFTFLSLFLFLSVSVSFAAMPTWGNVYASGYGGGENSETIYGIISDNGGCDITICDYSDDNQANWYAADSFDNTYGVVSGVDLSGLADLTGVYMRVTNCDSGLVSGNAILDNTAPSITVDSLDDYSVNAGATVAVTSTASDAGSGIATCFAYLSTDTNLGGDVQLEDLGSDCSGDATIPGGTGEGTYYIIMNPIDNVGNSNDDASSALTVNNTPPTFTMQYYSDLGLTTPIPDNAELMAGTYYLKITSDKSLSANPTVTLDAQGTNNDVTDAATVSAGGNDYYYVRTIVSDAAADGTVLEDVSVTGTDDFGNTATDV
ncbi:hypothetical protein KJ780_04185, partial [Candidatus Micrarchaeota archaeon]|nr:hypothetical protein [Candidatus Micrarchaeota archaeon]